MNPGQLPVSDEERASMAGSLDHAVLAQSALQAYGLGGARLAFLGHSENVTFQVVSGSQTCLLRLHLPRTQTFGQHGSDPAAIRSELQWLAALARSGLPVPSPVRNRQGELVTRLAKGGTGLNASLLNWLEGSPYGRESESADSVVQMGRLVAALHRHASRWRLPPDFTRPQRDAAYFEQVLRTLSVTVDDGRVAYRDFRVIRDAVNKLLALMHSLRPTRRTHGLMHADLHRGNFLIADGRIKLIDFSFCAFGNFMFDLGICLAHVSPELHPLFLDSYQSIFPLPGNYAELIEGFFVGSYAGTLALWVPDPEAQELLARRAPYLAEEFAARFLQDRRFWFAA